MSQKIPYQFQRVKSLEQIEELLNHPYNRPLLVDETAKAAFEAEYQAVHALISDRLKTLGTVGNFGGFDFILGPEFSSDRAIGVVTTSPAVFGPELIHLIKNSLVNIDEDYLVYIDGEFDNGDSFYICITKNKDVIGFSKNPKLLEQFGFI